MVPSRSAAIIRVLGMLGTGLKNERYCFVILSWLVYGTLFSNNMRIYIFYMDLLMPLHSAVRCGFGRPIQSNSPMFLMLSDSLGW